MKKKVIQNKNLVKNIESIIKELGTLIKDMGKEISRLLLSDINLGKKYLLLKTIPGLELLLPANLLVLTNGFKKTVNPREIASYLGICPNEHRSGKSVYRKARSTGWGPGKMRKLLYLAASCVKRNYSEFKKYYLQKEQMGKAHNLILNNIGNKLLKIICGVIKSGKPYNRQHCSLPPVLVA